MVHFWTDAPLLHLAQLLKSLNAILPVSVKVIEVAKVPHLFHARYSAARKTYHYRVHNAAVLDPFKRLYALHVKQKLNVEKIRLGAKFFEGEHNFSAFANRSDIKERDPVRIISRFDVVQEVRLHTMEVARERERESLTTFCPCDGAGGRVSVGGRGQWIPLQTSAEHGKRPNSTFTFGRHSSTPLDCFIGLVSHGSLSFAYM